MVDPRRYSNDAWQRQLGEMADKNRGSNGGGGGDGGGGAAWGIVALIAFGFAASSGLFEGDNTSVEEMVRNASPIEKKYPSIAVATLANGAATQRSAPSTRAAQSLVCSFGTMGGCSVRAYIEAGTPACLTYMELGYDTNGLGRIRHDFRYFITSSQPSEAKKESICDGYSEYLKRYCRARRVTTCNFN